MNRATIAQGTRPSRQLPQNTRTRLQHLLDEGDENHFARHPDEQYRIRFYFQGEHMDDRGEPTRYLIVTRQPDGTLTRRWQREEAGAA